MDVWVPSSRQIPKQASPKKERITFFQISELQRLYNSDPARKGNPGAIPSVYKPENSFRPALDLSLRLGLLFKPTPPPRARHFLPPPLSSFAPATESQQRFLQEIHKHTIQAITRVT